MSRSVQVYLTSHHQQDCSNLGELAVWLGVGKVRMFCLLGVRLYRSVIKFDQV
jgi:hypothetical protein